MRLNNFSFLWLIFNNLFVIILSGDAKLRKLKKWILTTLVFFTCSLACYKVADTRHENLASAKKAFDSSDTEYGCTNNYNTDDSIIANDDVTMKRMIEKKYSGNWSKVLDSNISSVYFSQLMNVTDYCYNLSTAADELNVTREYLGCGVVAMYSMLNYIALNCGYSQFDNKAKQNGYSDKGLFLARKIIETTNPYIFVFPNEQAGISSGSFCSCLLEILDYYFDDYSLFFELNKYRGGLFSNSYLTNRLKESVDSGMPATIMTWFPFGNVPYHYMNIGAYQKWQSDANQSKDFFNVKYNWDETHYSSYYFPEELFNDQVTVITISEVSTNYHLLTSSYGFEGQYFFYEKSKRVNADFNRFIETKRLRTGFIENNYLVMSARRSGAGIAFLQFELTKKINAISFLWGLWGHKENITTGSVLCSLKLEYLNGDNQWVTLSDFLSGTIPISIDKDSLNYYSFLKVKENFKVFRIITTNQAVGDSNKGRVVLGEINIMESKNEI